MRASAIWLLVAFISFSFAQEQTALPNEWLNLASQFQRDISGETPIHELSLPCAHNAFNNPMNLPPKLVNIEGFFRGNVVFENQRLTMTQLLDLGVRHLQLDVHFIPKYLKTLVCHGAEGPSKICQAIDSTIINPCLDILGFEDLGIHTGCSLHASTWDQALQEIKDWTDQHPEEFLWLDIEDQVSIEELAIEEQVSVPLLSKFKDQIFTKAELNHFRENFPDSLWPSTNQLLNLYNKTILFTGFGERFPSIQNINFMVVGFPNYPENAAKFFKHTNCSNLEQNFTYFYESDIKIDLTPLGIKFIQTGHDEVGEITDLTLTKLISCGFSGCLDLISEFDMVSTIWTWSQSASPIACEEDLCPVLLDGSWQHVSCSQNLFYAACQNDTNPLDWILVEATTFQDVSCSHGSTFSFPVTPLQNKALKAAADGYPVWLNVPLKYDPTHPVCSYVPSPSSPFAPSSFLSLLLLSFTLATLKLF